MIGTKLAGENVAKKLDFPVATPIKILKHTNEYMHKIPSSVKKITLLATY